MRTLGVGGMGSVWLAHDLLLDSACALKLIDDDKARTEEVRVRFAREAKVAAQLRGAHCSSGTKSAGMSASNMLPPQPGTTRKSSYG